MATSSHESTLSRAAAISRRLWDAHKDGIVKMGPLIGGAAGTAAIAASVWAAESSPALASGLKTFGAAVLGGGIFGLMMKYLVVVGVVREEIEKSFQTESFRHQLIDFHIRATGQNEKFNPYPMRRYLELNFPELAPHYDTSFRYYSNGHFDHYFSRITRRITIKSLDENGFLHLEDTHIFVDKPRRAEDKIFFGFQLSRNDVPLGKDATDLYCEIDTVDRSNELVWNQMGGVSFAAELQGRPEYVVKRRLIRTWSVLSALHMTLQRLSTNLTVEIRNEEPESVDVHLEFINIYDFPLTPIPRPIGKAVELEYILPPLMLPQQGYILTFRTLKKVEVQGAPMAGDMTQPPVASVSGSFHASAG